MTIQELFAVFHHDYITPVGVLYKHNNCIVIAWFDLKKNKTAYSCLNVVKPHGKPFPPEISGTTHRFIFKIPGPDC